jgi:eukaryotic-like serine/threonine-protein kinase
MTSAATRRSARKAEPDRLLRFAGQRRTPLPGISAGEAPLPLTLASGRGIATVLLGVTLGVLAGAAAAWSVWPRSPAPRDVPAAVLSTPTMPSPSTTAPPPEAASRDGEPLLAGQAEQAPATPWLGAAAAAAEPEQCPGGQSKVASAGHACRVASQPSPDPPAAVPRQATNPGSAPAPALAGGEADKDTPARFDATQPKAGQRPEPETTSALPGTAAGAVGPLQRPSQAQDSTPPASGRRARQLPRDWRPPEPRSPPMAAPPTQPPTATPPLGQPGQAPASSGYAVLPATEAAPVVRLIVPAPGSSR